MQSEDGLAQLHARHLEWILLLIFTRLVLLIWSVAQHEKVDCQTTVYMSKLQSPRITCKHEPGVVLVAALQVLLQANLCKQMSLKIIQASLKMVWCVALEKTASLD